MIGRRIFLGIGVAAVGSAAVTQLAYAGDIAPADLRRMEQLVEMWMSDRGRRVCGTGPQHRRLAGTVLPRSSRKGDANLHLVGRAVGRLHSGFSGFFCEAGVRSYSADGTRVTALVEVRGTFEFRDQSAAKTTAWRAAYACHFEHDQGQWRLIEAAYQADSKASMDNPPLVELDGAAFSARIDSMVDRYGLPGDERGADTNHIVVPYYNYPAMRTYALAWWDGQNPAYPTWGDDCTNFVSQVLHAGGWQTVGSYPWDPRPDNSKWWYGSYTWSTSYSWSASENLYQFTNISGRGTALSSIWNLITGNTLHYDFDHNGNKDHVQICTAYSSSSGPLMTQHSSSYVDRPLSQIIASSSTNQNAWYYPMTT